MYFLEAHDSNLGVRSSFESMSDCNQTETASRRGIGQKMKRQHSIGSKHVLKPSKTNKYEKRQVTHFLRAAVRAVIISLGAVGQV